ncbi:CLPTM1-like membrane protein cnrB [Vitis vinifera]|uniref:CLPTM1-like membrane protein cnrB n=1 Tax=Vitis vinifera TaxID=29760 RepID=A0A438KIW0_VITVI|nr:CLPTM1-like membrane protein cnrB [Vitis vinifera]
MTKWQLFLQIDQSFQIHRSYGSMIEGEADELKGILGRKSLSPGGYNGGLMSSFDIQFWNKNKSMEGLSAKSVVVSFISQLIVFLYLLDNDTSWMILASSGVGCCIEFWKIGKAMHIEPREIFMFLWKVEIYILLHRMITRRGEKENR